MDTTTKLANRAEVKFQDLKMVVFIVENTLHVTIFPPRKSTTDYTRNGALKLALQTMFGTHFQRPVKEYSVRQIKLPTNTKEQIYIAIIK